MLRIPAAVAVLVAAALGAPDNPYGGVLEGQNIAASREGITAYIHRLFPPGATTKTVEALIRQLANPEPAARESAVRQLSAMPFLAAERVRTEMQRADPEVRRLCKRIVAEHISSRPEETLNAAFHTIRILKLKGFAPLLMATIPRCPKEFVTDPAVRAIAPTAETRDAPIFDAGLASPNRSVRIASAHGIGSVRGAAALPALRPLLNDAEDAVRLAVAEIITRLNGRDAVSTFVDLMESPDAAVRSRACGILRALTGERFGFVSYYQADKREAVVARWRAYVKKHGAEVPVKLPLVFPPPPLGRTLVCTINTRRLEEYDKKGVRIYQSAALEIPWGCHGLPNGHRLVAVFEARVVLEFDARGKETWRTKVLPGQPMSVRRLEDGNTLIACGDSGKVVETDRTGAVVWSVTLPGRPSDARRLGNGRTLVALYAGKRIAEVDAKGTIVWQVRGKGTPTSAERLPNGNTLVAGLEPGRVTEYNPSGRAVWRVARPGTIYEAQRLPNGNTMLGTSAGATEIDARGRVVWNKDLGPCRVMRY